MNVSTEPDPAHRAAQAALLDALARDATLSEVEREVRRHAHRGFVPDLAVLELGAAAMQLAQVTHTSPLDSAVLLSRHLPELQLRNRRALRERTTYAVQAVAALNGGLTPNVLDDTYWWGIRDIVEHAVHAAVAYVRACADRRGQDLPAFVRDLGAHLGLL